MTPLAVLPIWTDAFESRACTILMYRDRWEIEVMVFGACVANAQVPSFEAAFDLADQCRPRHVKATLKES
jgi:hypothetical protein